jgi:hypothetical protein
MRVLLLYLSCALFPGFLIPGLILWKGRRDWDFLLISYAIVGIYRVRYVIQN